jgi:hypothetical protein
MIFGIVEREAALFYRRWKHLVDEPEFKNLKKAVKLRQLDEQIEELKEKRKKISNA